MTNDMFSNLVSKYQRYISYYKGHHKPKDLGIALPKHLSGFKPSLGWAKIGVDKFCDRIIPVRFDSNNLLSSQLTRVVSEAVKTAAICGISYLVVYEDAAGWSVKVANPLYSFAEINPITRGITSYRENSLKEDSYLIAGGGECIYYGDLTVRKGMHVFPVVHQQTSIDLYGQSRITKPVRDIIDSAVRTLARAEVSAEFYSFPQAVLLGADVDYLQDDDVSETVKNFVAGIGRLLTLPPNEETQQNPSIQQLEQQSFAPHTDQLNQLARLCAAELNIDVSELGIYETNPTSADALYAAKEDLILECKAFEKANEAAVVGAVSALIEGNGLDTTPELVWAEPATPTPASQADAFAKLVNAIPALALSRSGLRLAGLDESAIDEIAGELYG
jgi:hypothetical protein